MTTRLERTVERAADSHTTPALEALPVIDTRPVESMVGRAPVTVVRGLLHLTMTDICKHYPESTENIIQGVTGVSIFYIFLS